MGAVGKRGAAFSGMFAQRNSFAGSQVPWFHTQVLRYPWLPTRLLTSSSNSLPRAKVNLHWNRDEQRDLNPK